MNKIIAWFAANKVAANLLMAGIIIAGSLSYMRMERETNITVPLPMFQVTVAWPGAAPQEVEEQIVIRIEEALTDLDNVDRIVSRAQEGSGWVFIEAVDGVNTDRFLNEIKNRVDGISTFPRDIMRPQVVQFKTRSQQMMLAIYGDVDEKTLKRAAESARDEIVHLPGAQIVQIYGMRPEEVAVELSEEDMRRYGMSFDEVARAIRGSSINRSSGRIETETGDIMLRARNLANTQDEFENIVVRQAPPCQRRCR